MNEKIIAGPFKCALPGCFDPERHTHSPASLIQTISSLTQKLSEATSLLTAEQVKRVNEYARAEPLISWIKDPQRQSANTAFTAGCERQVAYAVEAVLTGSEREIEQLIVAQAVLVDALRKPCGCGYDGQSEHTPRRLGACYQTKTLDDLPAAVHSHLFRLKALERVAETGKKIAPQGVTSKQLRSAPDHLSSAALADFMDALAALDSAGKEGKKP